MGEALHYWYAAGIRRRSTSGVARFELDNSGTVIELRDAVRADGADEPVGVDGANAAARANGAAEADSEGPSFHYSLHVSQDAGATFTTVALWVEPERVDDWLVVAIARGSVVVAAVTGAGLMTVDTEHLAATALPPLVRQWHTPSGARTLTCVDTPDTVLIATEAEVVVIDVASSSVRWRREDTFVQAGANSVVLGSTRAVHFVDANTGELRRTPDLAPPMQAPAERDPTTYRIDDAELRARFTRRIEEVLQDCARDTGSKRAHFIRGNTPEESMLLQKAIWLQGPAPEHRSVQIFVGVRPGGPYWTADNLAVVGQHLTCSVIGMDLDSVLEREDLALVTPFMRELSPSGGNRARLHDALSHLDDAEAWLRHYLPAVRHFLAAEIAAFAALAAPPPVPARVGAEAVTQARRDGLSDRMTAALQPIAESLGWRHPWGVHVVRRIEADGAVSARAGFVGTDSATRRPRADIEWRITDPAAGAGERSARAAITVLDAIPRSEPYSEWDASDHAEALSAPLTLTDDVRADEGDGSTATATIIEALAAWTLAQTPALAAYLS